MPIDLLTLAKMDVVLKGKNGQFSGPCPVCHGDNRFYVNTKIQMWGCRTCKPGYSDVYEYLKHYKGMSFPAAKAYIQNGQSEPCEQQQRHKEPGQAWHERAELLVLSAAGALYSKSGQAALQYLYGRGLTDKTITTAKIGYAFRFHPLLERNVPCIVLPWYEGKKVLRVEFRNITAVEKNERYFNLGESSNTALYLADTLQAERAITVIVESVMCALTLAQECSDICNVVATGSTTGSRTTKNAIKLAHCQTVLVSFDNDEKGKANAKHWLDRLDNSIRYRPLGHDVNDMHTAGLSVRSWITAARNLTSETDQEEKQIEILPAGRNENNNNNLDQVADIIAPPDQDMTIDTDQSMTTVDPVADELQDEEDITRCSFCSNEVEHFSETGIALCSQHKVATDAAMAFLKSAWPGQGDIALIPGKPPVHVGASTEPIIAPIVLPSELLTLATCAHYETKLIRDKNNSFLVRSDGLCKQKRVMPGLFCERHKHHALILEMGAKVGYPALQLNQYVSIEAGYSAWLEHARRRTSEQLIGIVPKKGKEKLSPEINGDLQVVKRAIDRILQEVR